MNDVAVGFHFKVNKAMSTRIRTFKADGTTPLFRPLTNMSVYDYSRLSESRK